MEFDREHLRLLTDQASAEAEGLKAANARLRAVISVGLELASERDPDRLLRTVCDTTRDLFGATYVTIGILDRNDQTVKRVVGCGAPVADWIKPGNRLSGILATVVEERRTLRGDNPGGDPAALCFPLLHPEVRAFLATPIASPAHVYGWICLVGNDGRSFGEDDEHLLMVLSGLVGRTYENGYLYSAAQEHAETLEQQILARNQAEVALRHERDRAQQYLDTAEVMLVAIDLDGRITLVNRHACSILGWSADKLLGRDWIDTCLPAPIRDAMRARFQTLVGGDLSIMENPVLTRSGEERLIEWRNTLLRDHTGRVIGTFSSGTDVTERNRAVDALRTAEERMRFAMEAAGVGIWDMDFTTGVDRWSETMEAHYGLRPGTFGGTFEAFVECIHPDDRASLLETVGKRMKSGGDFSVQSRSIWPDGTVRWLTTTGRIHLDRRGQPLRAIGITLDVTEHRALEEQYQAAQKMEAIGRLAGGVAHDFNNLLTTILGYCELLLADLDPADRRHTDITEIQKAGMRAAGLTRQLLAFGRKQIIRPTLLDLNAVMSEVQAMLARLIGEDVKVVLRLEAGLAPVKADRGQVEQIVVNLAVNARDAMPKGGTLTIETANVNLGEQYAKAHVSVKPGAYVALTVTDTGVGMTPEVQARLFEPFFTTKEVGKGTGLGLAAVHGIVMRGGGSIDVHTEVGRGASFTVYLPRADASEEAVEAPRPVSRQGTGPETVLLVEDAEGLRQVTTRLLRRHGYTVLAAANADEALQLFEHQPSIALLLSDVVMPGESGPELGKRLLERRPGLRVVYMSGYTEEAIVERGELVPGVSFLQKPFSFDALGRKVREELDR